MITFLGQTILK